MIPEKIDQETVKNILASLLEKMGFQGAVDVTSPEGRPDDIFCTVQVAQDQNFLIGQQGVNLSAIQHIVRVLTRQQTGKRLNIIVDINGYFLQKKLFLEQEAEQVVSQVLREKVAVMFRPMPAYERKIIHTYLTTHPEVMTESIGQGLERKIRVCLRTSIDSEGE
ncbi:MAG: protein jag [Minisyncoccota bacterium]